MQFNLVNNKNKVALVRWWEQFFDISAGAVCSILVEWSIIA